MTGTETPLNTCYANQVLDGGTGWGRINLTEGLVPDAIWHGCASIRDLDATRLTEARAEDRFIAFLCGALPSEVWA